MDQPLHILILEDDPSDAELIQRQLRKANLPFTARCVQDKRTFLQALDAATPDLLLADYSLPGFDGLSALQLLRQRDPGVPGIIVSGAIGEELAIEALKAGATDYVLKQRLSRLGPVVQRAMDQVRQLAERKLAEEALRSSEERFRLLVAAVKEYAIVMLDAQGRIATWNAGAQRIKGYTEEEILGRHFSCFYPPEDIAAGKPQEVLASAARDGQVVVEGWRLRKDGSRFWGNVTITAARDAAGNLGGFAKVTRDMTEQRRSEQELLAAKAEAEAASKAKDHFLAVLSHELRNPLNPVLATASMLRDDPRFDADTRQQLEVICRNAELEARLIDDLLDITRIEHGKIVLDRQPAELTAIARRAAEVCMPGIRARNLQFAIHAPDGPCFVNGDPARLQQVFWNLIRNATKFTPPGGRIDLHCRREDVSAVAQVSDSGEGIAPEALGRIFNAFEQGSSSTARQFGGLGLGLAITRALVELHGGSIKAHSDGKGKGSTFTVRLPLLAGPAASPASTSPAALPEMAARALRILLVEDHADTAKVMGRLLNMHGHQAQIASDVAGAISLARAQSFDLLISDLGLPDGSGIDLILALRQQGHSFPAIALSGYGHEQDIQRSRDAGFAVHLTKPINMAQLLRAIASATQRLE